MQKEKHVSDFNQDETKPVATSSPRPFSLALEVFTKAREKRQLGTRLILWLNLSTDQEPG